MCCNIITRNEVTSCSTVYKYSGRAVVVVSSQNELRSVWAPSQAGDSRGLWVWVGFLGIPAGHLVSWFMGRFLGGFLGIFMAWFLGGFLGMSADCFVSWFLGMSADRLVSWFLGMSADCPVSWFLGRSANRLVSGFHGGFGQSRLGSQYLQSSVSVVLMVGQRLVIVSRSDSWVWTKVWLPP